METQDVTVYKAASLGEFLEQTVGLFRQTSLQALETIKEELITDLGDEETAQQIVESPVDDLIKEIRSEIAHMRENNPKMYKFPLAKVGKITEVQDTWVYETMEEAYPNTHGMLDLLFGAGVISNNDDDDFDVDTEEVS